MILSSKFSSIISFIMTIIYKHINIIGLQISLFLFRSSLAIFQLGGYISSRNVVSGAVIYDNITLNEVAIDDLGMREMLFKTTLHQEQPDNISATSARIKWKLISSSTHLNEVLIIGCNKGFGEMQEQKINIPEKFDLKYNEIYIKLSFEEVRLLSNLNKNSNEKTSKCINTQIFLQGAGTADGTLVNNLQPYSSYWFVLVPYYKGIMGLPSNLRSIKTSEGVPSVCPLLSRWYAASTADGYVVTLHWNPLRQHEANGIIYMYQLQIKERTSGRTHNMTISGEITSLTLPNVTSSRVSVILSASTRAGTGPPSSPIKLNLFLTHHAGPGAALSVLTSVWFLLFAGGSVLMLLFLTILICFSHTIVDNIKHFHRELPDVAYRRKSFFVNPLTFRSSRIALDTNNTSFQDSASSPMIIKEITNTNQESFSESSKSNQKSNHKKLAFATTDPISDRLEPGTHIAKLLTNNKKLSGQVPESCIVLKEKSVAKPNKPSISEYGRCSMYSQLSDDVFCETAEQNGVQLLAQLFSRQVSETSSDTFVSAPTHKEVSPIDEVNDGMLRSLLGVSAYDSYVFKPYKQTSSSKSKTNIPFINETAPINDKSIAHKSEKVNIKDKCLDHTTNLNDKSEVKYETVSSTKMRKSVSVTLEASNQGYKIFNKKELLDTKIKRTFSTCL